MNCCEAFLVRRPRDIASSCGVPRTRIPRLGLFPRLPPAAFLPAEHSRCRPSARPLTSTRRALRPPLQAVCGRSRLRLRALPGRDALRAGSRGRCAQLSHRLAVTDTRRLLTRRLVLNARRFPVATRRSPPLPPLAPCIASRGAPPRSPARLCFGRAPLGFSAPRARTLAAHSGPMALLGAPRSALSAVPHGEVPRRSAAPIRGCGPTGTASRCPPGGTAPLRERPLGPQLHSFSAAGREKRKLSAGPLPRPPRNRAAAQGGGSRRSGGRVPRPPGEPLPDGADGAPAGTEPGDSSSVSHAAPPGPESCGTPSVFRALT